MEEFSTKHTTKRIADQDATWIAAGKDNKERAIRENLIKMVIDANGVKNETTPGVAASYIPASNYYQLVRIPDQPDTVNMAIENALNWDACDRGKGGLAAAGVRMGLRDLFDSARETNVVTVFTDAMAAIVEEYTVFYRANPNMVGFWAANAHNVLGLAAACFYRECHHWDARNLRPQKALLGSLNQLNDIPEIEYRRLFYLSVHPIPLNILARVREAAADPRDVTLCEAVRIRLIGMPAGYTEVGVCAAAVDSLKAEAYYTELPEVIRDRLDALVQARDELLTNSTIYHPFAAKMGAQHRVLDKTPLTEAMIIMSGYIKSQVKGTLADSAALGKFINNHQRKVNRIAAAMDSYSEKTGDDLISILTGVKKKKPLDPDEHADKILRRMVQVSKVTSQTGVDLNTYLDGLVNELKDIGY